MEVAVISAGIKDGFHKKWLKFRKEAMVIGIILLLILLTLWGWYLKTNQVEVFEAGGLKEKQEQQTNRAVPASNVESSKTDLSNASVKDQPQQVKNATDQKPEAGTVEEVRSGPAGVQAKININLASAKELVALNGIGEVKAKAIVAYREQNGAFERIDQIQDVKGIGEATYNKIKDWITVNTESP